MINLFISVWPFILISEVKELLDKVVCIINNEKLDTNSKIAITKVPDSQNIQRNIQNIFSILIAFIILFQVRNSSNSIYPMINVKQHF